MLSLMCSKPNHPQNGASKRALCNSFVNFEDLFMKLGEEVWDIDPIILRLNVTEKFKL